MSQPVFSKKDCGCYVDDARGYGMGKRIQEIAQSYGWGGEAILDPDAEFYDEATDDAIAYLNSLCDSYVTFTSENGPFCLVEIDEA